MDTTTRFSAPDIECDGCANAIKKALGAVAGVSAVAVDVGAKTVAVTHDAGRAPRETVAAALDRAGFPATAAV
jgi:copper chaperone CopZ